MKIEYPMKRELSGAFLRVKRGEKYEPIDFTDMTDAELDEHFKDKSAEDLVGWIKCAIHALRDVGEQFDITRTMR